MLDNIVEVQQVRFRAVNQYLAHGYTLLSIDHTATAGKNENMPYVKRSPVYIVGRTGETDHFENE